MSTYYCYTSLALFFIFNSKNNNLCVQIEFHTGKKLLSLFLKELGPGFIANNIVILLFLVICGIIAMSCGTSLVNELHDYDKQIDIFPNRPYSYGQSYGIVWASVAIALIGSIISTIGLFQLQADAGNPIMNSNSAVTLL